MKIGLNFPGEIRGDLTLNYSKLAEKNGFESVWIGENYFLRDSISITSAIASVTSRIKVATCIINPYTRNSALISMTVASLDEISKGRLILGLGPSIPQWIDLMDKNYTKPLESINKCVHQIRQLLRGQMVEGVKLDFEPVRKKIPIYIAATSPKMLRLAGKIADGVILTSCTPPKHILNAIKEVQDGTKEAGRGSSEISIAICIASSISKDSKKALDEIKNPLVKFLSYNHIAIPDLYNNFSEIAIKDIISVVEAFKKGDMKKAADKITNEMIDELTISGTPGEFEVKINEFHKIGIEIPILYFPPSTDIKQAIKLIGKIMRK